MALSRRDFIRLSSLAGASLVLEIGCREAGGDSFHPSQWLAIHPDGRVTLYVGKMEMGQGIHTGLALIVAEELDVDPGALELRIPSTVGRFARGRPLRTGASASTSRMWRKMRTAGAAAREMLVAAAAEGWGVPVGTCQADNGTVRHPASGRSRSYGQLAAPAALQPVPQLPAWKETAKFRWLGRPTPRLDGPEIVTGRRRFSCDVRLEGQRFAVVARPPAPGDKLRRLRKKKRALSLDGVEQVLRIGESVGVVGDSTWSAMQGRRALRFEWQPGPAAGFSTEAFETELESALEASMAPDGPADWRPDFDPPRATTVRAEGDAVGALAGGERQLEAVYSTPFQTHVPMEPRNATVQLGEDRCEVWCGTQFPNETQRAITRFLGWGSRRVVVHPQFMGGSFGQKETAQFAVEAVAVARAAGGGPIQVFWPRADDVKHSDYHPGTRQRLRAALDDGGRIAAWHHRIAAPSVEKLWPFGQRNPQAVPPSEAVGAWNPPYRPDHLQVEYVDLPCPIRLGFWRGVESVANLFAVECFVDELALAARMDPLEFRLRNLGDTIPLPDWREGAPFDLARLRAALRLAADRSGWGSPLPPGRGRGIAGIVFDGRTACASVAEVTVKDRQIRVDRFVSAIDCGFVVNPLGLAGNAESAIAWGLSALFSEITIAEGRTRESNHLDYPILRLPEMPRVEIHTVSSDHEPSGVGEIPVPTVAPAVVNAVFAATGRRLRRLPIRPGDLAEEPV